MTREAHEGGCHCGAVRYRVTVDLAEPVLECNCSHCSVKGFLLAFAPASYFEQLAGADSLTEYRFNRHRIGHLFCTTCGVQAFGRGSGQDGSEMVAVNIRSLDGVDLDALERKAIDGRSF